MVWPNLLLQPRKIHSLRALFFLTRPVLLLTAIRNLAMGFGLGLVTTDTADNLSSVCL
jgi:hypothetical protein